jgi:hypothetical protein
MSGKKLSAAKRKEQETRARLGPRLGYPKIAPHRFTLDPRRPRATGSLGAAIGDNDGKVNGSS